MAYRNVTREDAEEAFYHVYNRGVNGMEIFRDEEDYRFFERLLTRHLSREIERDRYGREYMNFSGNMELHAYCLMPNHYHLLLFQKEKKMLEKFMSTVVTPYTGYFNRKYKRRGPLYESPYKAVMVDGGGGALHVSRYVHLNPIGYRVWEHSSYGDYLYGAREWIETGYVLGEFKSRQDYLEYVEDYEGVKRENDRYKRSLGDI